MDFVLRIKPIETKPRAGYYLLTDDNNFEIVKKVVPQRNQVVLESGKVISIEDASKRVAKLIGEVTKEKDDKVIVRTYSIIHGDYDRIIKDLNNAINYDDDVPEEDRKYKTLKDALFANVEVKYKGLFESVFTRTVVDEVVKFVNIDVIDKYQLYDVDDRVGVVTNFNKLTRVFDVKLNTNGEIVKCKREDFIKVKEDNIVNMLHVPCAICKR